MDQPILTEIPSYLKQLARLITRGFYQIEDALIMDMLVRHTCMKEKDIEDLLKFDLKLLRSRMATLKNEKLVQIRLRMETGIDGKAQKVNYYFINYKSLVNVIKYKLDHLRKRIETQARDATNRASFKCSNCQKSFTDLEAGELYDPATDQFFCTFCKCTVEEDESAVPQKDSRILLARFNEQLSTIFELLRKAENIKLAPELLEPEPMKSPGQEEDGINGAPNERGGVWSGESTRKTGGIDTQIDIKFGDEASLKPQQEKKERPIWMTESTVGDYEGPTSTFRQTASDNIYTDKDSREDVMALLLSHEKRDSSHHHHHHHNHDHHHHHHHQNIVIPGSNEDEQLHEDHLLSHSGFHNHNGHSISGMEVDNNGEVESDEDDDQTIFVTVGTDRIPLNKITENELKRMTITERDNYVRLYQEQYADMYD